MIPIGTLCIATEDKYNISRVAWNTMAAGKIVTVVGYYSIFTPQLDHKVDVPNAVANPWNCAESELIPISNPGLTDELQKETAKELVKEFRTAYPALQKFWVTP